jgi:hypothetical protein
VEEGVEEGKEEGVAEGGERGEVVGKDGGVGDERHSEQQFHSGEHTVQFHRVAPVGMMRLHESHTTVAEE